MAPVNQPTYSKDEKVLCFHHELLYEAKVLDSKHTDEKDKKSPMQYRVHYKGWKNTWDDWVPEDRLRKLNDENKALATHLRNQYIALQKPAKPSMSAATKKKNAGSDLSSTRGSEERHASLPATGRGQKRGRDNDIEKASDPISLDQRRSSSRKRRKTSKAESPPPPPPGRKKGKAKADMPPVHGTRKATVQAPPEVTAESEVAPPFESQHQRVRVLPEALSFYERFSLDGSKLKSFKPPFLPEKSSAKHDSDESQLSSIRSSPQDPDQPPTVPEKSSAKHDSNESQLSSVRSSPQDPDQPPTVPEKSSAKHDSDESHLSSVRSSPQDPDLGNAYGREQGLEARQNSRSERAETRHAHKDQPHGARSTVAGIPLDDTPADLVPFVKKKRQRVKNMDKKVKFTNKPTQQQEETFNMRPAIHINVPDHLKSILVDDWENVTKNLSLVPLPSKPSANEILTSYFDEEKNKRHLGSPEADLLEEVVAGLKEYFEKCVGRILLYRFERQQYLEVYNAVQAGTGEYEGKGMGDIYGAEHLCRLFVSLPELIAQTNMDQQSVNRLREELHKLTQWLGKNSTRFFKAPYENASQDYIEKVRGV